MGFAARVIRGAPHELVIERARLALILAPSLARIRCVASVCTTDGPNVFGPRDTWKAE